jgi:hypothetical protein
MARRSNAIDADDAFIPIDRHNHVVRACLPVCSCERLIGLRRLDSSPAVGSLPPPK